jgi:hypothetical protein
MSSIPKMRTIMASSTKKRSRSWLPLLLILPFIVLLWPPFYNFREPSFIGVPFFYWFQLLWVIITAIITAVVYFAGA